LYIYKVSWTRRCILKWMVSWQNGEWSSSPDYDYTYDKLISHVWYDNVNWMLGVITPIYKLLRYANREKNAKFHVI
jgi:hypothetical protein